MRRPGPSPKAIQRLRANGPALPASSLVPESPLKVGCAIGDALAGLPPELLIELVARAGAHALEVAGREELLKLVEHEVVGRRLRIPEVRERHVRAREPHKIGPHVRILPAGGPFRRHPPSPRAPARWGARSVSRWPGCHLNS